MQFRKFPLQFVPEVFVFPFVNCMKITVMETIIFPDDLHGWDITACHIKWRPRRVFKNRMPNRMFEAKRKDVKESWRKLHSEKIHDCMSHQISLRASSVKKIGAGALLWMQWWTFLSHKIAGNVWRLRNSCLLKQDNSPRTRLVLQLPGKRKLKKYINTMYSIFVWFLIMSVF